MISCIVHKFLFPAPMLFDLFHFLLKVKSVLIERRKKVLRQKIKIGQGNSGIVHFLARKLGVDVLKRKKRLGK